VRSRLVLLTLVATAIAPPAAGADSSRPGDVAAALQGDPVYVAPARSGRLDTPARGRIRLLILRKDIGRIHIAVVPAGWAAEAGGVRAFANAIDNELRAKGALMVVADRSVHVVTSHDHATAAATGVQRAFDRGGGLEAKLRHSVEALADVDPGASGDVGQAPPTVTLPKGFPDANRITKDVNDTIRFTVIAVILAALAPFVFVAGWLWWRGRRRRAADAEVFGDDLEAAKAERAALGDDIVDLDVPTSMPNVAPDVRAAYERALDAYDKSELALKKANNQRRLKAAAALIAAGRRDAAIARQGVAPGTTNPV
jgi:hypothetical protein